MSDVKHTEERTETHACDNERTETHDLDLQPTCNQLATDLISRQVAIDALTHKWDGMVTSVFDVLKELPSAEPQWIPVSERLPGETGEYLTTTMYGDVFCDHWQSCNFDRTEMVIAWMPLPKPYKAGESE